MCDCPDCPLPGEISEGTHNSLGHSLRTWPAFRKTFVKGSMSQTAPCLRTELSKKRFMSHASALF